MNLRITKLLPVVTALSVATFSTPAFARLGSFEANDGYDIPYGKPWSDVTYYNAGQYGSNYSPPTNTFQQIPHDTGLWKLKSGSVGGYFNSFSTRMSTVGTYPPYPTTYPSNLVPIYAVGHHFGGRTGNALALRNDSSSGTGAMELDYTLDSSDFGGMTASSANITNVLMKFYFCPNPGGAPPSSVGEKFIMSLQDSLFNTGLEIGYDYNNKVFWRNTANYDYSSGIVADSSAYDGFQVNLDLVNDKFTLDYFDVSASIPQFTQIASGPLLTPMQDFTHIKWKLNDQVNSGSGGKNLFDDFSFTVTKKTPEPSMIVPLSILGLGLLISSRKVPSGSIR